MEELALEVMLRPDVWRCIADKLPLLSKAMCWRVSRALQGAVEGDGLDYGVVTLCCALEHACRESIGRDVYRKLVPRDGEGQALEGAAEDGRRGEVALFLIDALGALSAARDRDRVGCAGWRAETWVKLAMLQRDGGWLCEGAKRTRTTPSNDDKCELLWTRLHLAIVRGDGEGAAALEEEGGGGREAETLDDMRSLHLAALKGRVLCMRKLLGEEEGAETHADHVEGRRGAGKEAGNAKGRGGAGKEAGRGGGGGWKRTRATARV